MAMDDDAESHLNILESTPRWSPRTIWGKDSPLSDRYESEVP